MSKDDPDRDILLYLWDKLRRFEYDCEELKEDLRDDLLLVRHVASSDNEKSPSYFEILHPNVGTIILLWAGCNKNPNGCYEHMESYKEAWHTRVKDLDSAYLPKLEVPRVAENSDLKALYEDNKNYGWSRILWWELNKSWPVLDNVPYLRSTEHNLLPLS